MNDIPNIPLWVKNRLIEAWQLWLDRNNNLIPEGWVKKIRKELTKFEKKMDARIPTISGFAMWSFCIVNQLGVRSSITSNGFTILNSTWVRGFDRDTTELLLLWINQAIKLTNIHPEIARNLGWG